MPNFFWDSEPTLHPLYAAIREYLEIDPRIKVLNERCRVFLELATILSDSIADAKMSAITWIIIVLIVISILVTLTEVTLRFGMLHKAGSVGAAQAVIWSEEASAGDVVHGVGSSAITVGQDSNNKLAQAPASDLEILARTLGLPSNATFDDIHRGIQVLQQDSFTQQAFVEL